MMTTETIGTATVDVDAEGFFVHPEQWNEAMVPDLAHREGMGVLSDRHWQVIRFMRREFDDNGTGPTVRALSKSSDIPIKE
ncbi:MAG TPA: TusE/DsrC/DsvC family sulfur relay protein, partial [Chloroflexota bacterium]